MLCLAHPEAIVKIWPIKHKKSQVLFIMFMLASQNSAKFELKFVCMVTSESAHNQTAIDHPTVNSVKLRWS